jgi:hypothetical protein
MNGLLRRRNGKGRSFLSFTIIAADLLILGYAIRNITFFFSSRNNERTVEVTTLPQQEALDITALEVPKEFEFSLPGAPVCEELKQEEVAYTLALHMSDTRLWMMQQHCALWGESAPISIAIWTSIGEEEILETLRSVGCRVDYITIGIIPSDSMSLVDYPINTLRNLALSGVATSHALVLDVDMFPSIDLFDTLNLPSVREALSNDPKLAVVVPAFQTEDLNCGSSSACLHRHLYWLPRDFEDLVIGLSTSKILPYDPTHFSRQGSTNYRGWMKQAHGELVDIPCVSSNQYQPYLVVRLCNHLPPFQPRFVGYGGNNMAWTMQLRRVGYRLQQVGGSFVAHFPHPDSQAKLESEKGPGPNENVRDRSDTTLASEQFAPETISRFSRL